MATMAEPTRPDRPDLETDFTEAIALTAAAARAHVRVRFVGQLYQHGQAQRYRHWRGVQFMLDLDPTLDEARALYDAVDACFDAVTRLGSLQVAHLLRVACEEPSPALPMGPEAASEPQEPQEPISG
jgi:hypothetical protein